jgi:hypothetical protein
MATTPPIVEQEEFETGPAKGLQTPIRLQDLRHVQLNPQEKVQLAQWYGTPAYQLWLKLSEGEIEKLETAHFQNWKDGPAFERTGLVAVSARLFFEAIQKECRHQMEEFSGEVEFVRSKQELLRTSLEDQAKKEFE